MDMSAFPKISTEIWKNFARRDKKLSTALIFMKTQAKEEEEKLKWTQDIVWS